MQRLQRFRRQLPIKSPKDRAAVAVAVIPAADAPITRAKNLAATMAAPDATAKPASAPMLRKAAGSQQSVHATVAVKVRQRHALATITRQAEIVALPLTAHLLPAVKTAATLAHLRATTAPKRAVMVISGAR